MSEPPIIWPSERPPQFSMKWVLALPVIVGVYLSIASMIGLWPAAVVLLAVAGLAWRPLRALVIITLGGGLLCWLMLPSVGSRPPTPRQGCQSNLHQIALAMRDYELTNGSFPPACVADKSGKPMHSWRVLILPQLGFQDFYARYRFDEPWNGPHNSKLLQYMPRIYRCPGSPNGGTSTNYVAIVGPHTAWPGAHGRKLSEFTNGPANTLLVVETTGTEIPWMEPRDLEFDKLPLAINPPSGGGISAEHPQTSRFPPRKPDGANAAFADGAVRWLPNGIAPGILKALITADGGERVDAERVLDP